MAGQESLTALPADLAYPSFLKFLGLESSTIVTKTIWILRLIEKTQLLSGLAQLDYVMAVFKILHWLHICFQLQFNLLAIIFNGLRPNYLRNSLSPYALLRYLRSAGMPLISSVEPDLACKSHFKITPHFRILLPCWFICSPLFG